MKVQSQRNGDELFMKAAEIRGLIPRRIYDDLLFIAASVKTTEEGLSDADFEALLRQTGWRGNLEQLGNMRLAYDLGRGARISK